jgi:hypothetical protein
LLLPLVYGSIILRVLFHAGIGIVEVVTSLCLLDGIFVELLGVGKSAPLGIGVIGNLDIIVASVNYQ